MGALAKAVTFEQETPKESGSLRDIWNNGYFWKGQFTRGADNRLLLTRIIDRLTSVSLQMAEKRTAANDLAGYYKHITGSDMPDAQKERLDEWASRGYNVDEYHMLSSSAIAMRRGRECCEYSDEVDQGEIAGKRFAAMIPFSDDDLFQSRRNN